MVSWKEMVTNVSRIGLIISFGVHCTNRTDPRFEEKKKEEKKHICVQNPMHTDTEVHVHTCIQVWCNKHSHE